MQGPDESRVETRSHLHTHATEKQVDIHDSQIRLFVPFHGILVGDLRNDGIRESQCRLRHLGALNDVNHLDGLLRFSLLLKYILR